MNKKLTAHLGLLGTNLFFAINLSAVKYLTSNNFMQPFGMNVIRVGVSVLLFWLLFLIYPSKEKIDRGDTGRFLLCALTGIAINQMLFLKGLSLTYSIHAVLLMLTTPILITIIAAWILKERLNIYKIAGLALGVSGAVVLITARQGSGSGENVLLGDLLVLINAVSYTFYFILVKPLMLKYNPVQVIRLVFTYGLLMVLPFGWNEFVAIEWNSFGATEYTCIGLITIGGTFLAYLFNVYGIKVLGASVAGAYIYIQPVFATIIAMIFLKEQLETYKLLAAALIFTGVFLCNKTRENRQVSRSLDNQRK
ncbi:MAG TPA: DMT family transporter [Ferruginibacter sp.]|nr:DMT family transporter [Ferruginibacter sp.]HPH90270.1 DMT family transporter [Ferruginibacter sp.]